MSTTISNIKSTVYSSVYDIGDMVISLPLIDRLRIPYAYSFKIGVIVICIIIIMLYFCISYMVGKKSGLHNASTIRYNIQGSQYGGNVIVSDSIISEDKLDVAMEGM